MGFPPLQTNLFRGEIPLIVMHFDINKTIIISDPAAEVTADQMLNSILSECIWGTLKRKSSMHEDIFDNSNLIGCMDNVQKLTRTIDKGTEGCMKSVLEYVPDMSQSKNVHASSISFVEPLFEDVNGIKEDVLHNYEWSLDEWSICHPDPSKLQPQKNSITYGEFIENYNFKIKMTKKETKYYKNRFTEKGMAGESVVNHFKILQNHLRFPKSQFVQDFINNINPVNADLNGQDNTLKENMEDMMVYKKEKKNESNDSVFTSEGKLKIDGFTEKNNIKKDNNTKKEELSIIKTILQSGYYHIIPSFFKLISYFHENNMNFRLIFRTFGTDIEKVKDEFNLYCQGKHPLFHMNDVPNQYQNDIENISSSNNEISFESNNIKNLSTSNKKEEEHNSEKEEVGVAQNLEPSTLPGVPEYTVKRVKMDGSCGRGIDRRLFSTYTRMIKRSSEGSEGTTLVRTDASKVSTDVILWFEFASSSLFCRFTLFYCIRFD